MNGMLLKKNNKVSVKRQERGMECITAGETAAFDIADMSRKTTNKQVPPKH